METWKICLKVASVRSSGASALPGSGICCDAPQVVTQLGEADGDCAPQVRAQINRSREIFRARLMEEVLVLDPN